MFTRTHPLPDGPRVRLRLARPSDRDAVAELLARRNAEAFEFGIRRLLRFNPAHRSVIAACAPIDGEDVLVGIAAIDHRPDAEVDTLVADERWWDGVAVLLVSALQDRARSRTRHVA